MGKIRLNIGRIRSDLAKSGRILAESSRIWRNRVGSGKIRSDIGRIQSNLEKSGRIWRNLIWLNSVGFAQNLVESGQICLIYQSDDPTVGCGRIRSDPPYVTHKWSDSTMVESGRIPKIQPCDGKIMDTFKDGHLCPSLKVITVGYGLIRSDLRWEDHGYF
ncbi:hypothetical protein FNV43_RR10517 [Rhamnella rubrinervis]|uniref:Uncharacterized protein n=1 Tax=Rhamnella rubrinervis TaxID=2594499 RepID=A0A8K0MGS6_9ROSA|nr:hypothetical protein FNV43_RR10517 [Rhamnella rubrinervis]